MLKKYNTRCYKANSIKNLVIQEKWQSHYVINILHKRPNHHPKFYLEITTSEKSGKKKPPLFPEITENFTVQS